MPFSWQALKAEHVYKLSAVLEKTADQSVLTIMRYMTIIRRFLQMSDCQIDKIDNQSLDLTRPKPKRRRKKAHSPDMWQSMDNPYARVIMAFQIDFVLPSKKPFELNLIFM